MPARAQWRDPPDGRAVPDPPGVRSPLTVAAPCGCCTHFAWLPGGRRLRAAVYITLLKKALCARLPLGAGRRIGAFPKPAGSAAKGRAEREGAGRADSLA